MHMNAPTYHISFQNVHEINFKGLYYVHLNVSEGIRRNQKYIIGLDSFSNQRFIYLACLYNTSLCLDYPVENCKTTVFSLAPFCL